MVKWFGYQRTTFMDEWNGHWRFDNLNRKSITNRNWAKFQISKITVKVQSNNLGDWGYVSCIWSNEIIHAIQSEININFLRKCDSLLHKNRRLAKCEIWNS